MILTSLSQIKRGDIIEVSEDNGTSVFRGVALFKGKANAAFEERWDTDTNVNLLSHPDGSYSIRTSILGELPYVDARTGEVKAADMPNQDVITMGLVGISDFKKQGYTVTKLANIYDTSSVVKKLKRI